MDIANNLDQNLLTEARARRRNLYKACFAGFCVVVVIGCIGAQVFSSEVSPNQSELISEALTEMDTDACTPGTSSVS